MTRNIAHIVLSFCIVVALIGLAGCTQQKASGPTAMPTLAKGTPAGGTPVSGSPTQAARPLQQTVVAMTNATATSGSPVVQPSPTLVPPTARPISTQPVVAQPTARPATPGTHVVQSGEWLWKIARQYNVSPQTIAAANPSVNFNQFLQPGQTLIIPAPGAQPVPAPTAAPGGTGQVTHVVQKGENLFRIALKYNRTARSVAVANGITNVSLIYPGQVLVIP